MFILHYFCQVASGTQFKLVLQILYFSDFLYQYYLILYLVQIVDYILLRPYEAVS